MNAIRYEWRRINSIHSTWVLTGTVLVIAVIAGLGTFLISVTPHGVAVGGQPIRTLAGTVNAYIPAALVLLTVLGAQAFGHEYRYGTIRPTAQAFPRRWQLLGAKMAMIALVTALTAAVSAMAVYLIVALGFRSQLHGGVFDSVQLRAAASGVLYLSAVAALAVALTAVTRSTVLAVVLIYAWAFGAEPLIGRAAKAASDFLPFGAAGHLMSPADGRVLLHAGVFIGGLTLAVASAGWLFGRRDITTR
jgi:ABC-2 type transport system permease protein